MATEQTLRLGSRRLAVVLEPATAILCDTVADAARVAAALGANGARVIDGADAARNTLAERLARRANPGRVADVIAELQLPEDILDWRLRECSALQRILADSLQALVEETSPLAFDLSALSASPFDIAHAFAHIARVRSVSTGPVVVVIADAAYCASAGAHLVVLSGDDLIELGPTESVLAQPASDAFRARLQATPIPNPLAMQSRRVQRAVTRPVDYSHTQIITLPTDDSIALAGGDAE